MLLERETGVPFTPRGIKKFGRKLVDVHTSSTPRDAAAFLQAFKLSLAWVLGLALHVVIIVRAASSTDEERGGKKRRRCRTDLFDGGD